MTILISRTIREQFSWKQTEGINVLGNHDILTFTTFFIKNRIDKSGVNVEYCTTHLMLAYYFPKPLMCESFCK